MDQWTCSASPGKSKPTTPDRDGGEQAVTVLLLAVINDCEAGLFRRGIPVLLNVGLVAKNIQATLFCILVYQQEFIPTLSEYLGGWKISTDRFPFCFGSLDLRPLVEERK